MKKEQLQEGMGSVNVEQEYDLSRIRALAGLANETTVAGTPVEEALGMVEGQKLDQMLNEIETSINRVEVKIKQYAAAYERMRGGMTEDEDMHYGYGVQAMLDLLDDMNNRAKKLG